MTGLSFTTQLHYRLYLYDSDFMWLYNVLVKACLCLNGTRNLQTREQLVYLRRDNAESRRTSVARGAGEGGDGGKKRKKKIESKHLAQ